MTVLSKIEVSGSIRPEHTTEGNWQWSFEWSMLTDTQCAKLLHATRHSGRSKDA